MNTDKLEYNNILLFLIFKTLSIIIVNIFVKKSFRTLKSIYIFEEIKATFKDKSL